MGGNVNLICISLVLEVLKTRPSKVELENMAKHKGLRKYVQK